MTLAFYLLRSDLESGPGEGIAYSRSLRIGKG